MASVALYFFCVISSGLWRWHVRQELGAQQIDSAAAAYEDPRCGLGELPMAVDGQPPECMTPAQFDAEKLADKAIAEGDVPDLLPILTRACGAGERGSCFELNYLAERLK
jgi:hypothetical protein